MFDIVLGVFLIGTLVCEVMLVLIAFRAVSTLGGVLEKLVDVYGKKPASTSEHSFSRPKQGKSGPITIDSLSPEIIAPNLGKLPKSSGFGSGPSNG